MIDHPEICNSHTLFHKVRSYRAKRARHSCCTDKACPATKPQGELSIGSKDALHLARDVARNMRDSADRAIFSTYAGQIACERVPQDENQHGDMTPQNAGHL